MYFAVKPRRAGSVDTRIAPFVRVHAERGSREIGQLCETEQQLTSIARAWRTIARHRAVARASRCAGCVDEVVEGAEDTRDALLLLERRAEVLGRFAQ